eukprot:4117804-Ditylum_brightwellii.AAC.1
MDQEEMLEVLENRILTLWKFQMDEEGFNASSSIIKEFTEMCIHYKECKPVMPEKLSTAHRNHSEREGKYKYCKYHGSCRHSTDEYNITIACNKGCTDHEYKKGSHKSKKVCFHSNKAKLCGFLSDKSKDLNATIDEKITKAFSCQEKKEKVDINKFEPLSVSSRSDAGDSN